MNENCDIITMQLPKKADYVGLVRLAASGVASKIGFDIDAIEDIKVAISEICNKIILFSQDSLDENYIIKFQLSRDEFKAYFQVSDKLIPTMFEGEAGEFARAIITSLMDEFTVKCNDVCTITMGKNLGD